MNTTVEPSRSEYIALIRRYLNGEIDGKTFGAGFQELQRRHKTLEDEKVRSWPKRYDLQLERDYTSGKISKDEFNKRWYELWEYKPGGWRDIVELGLFYLLDQYTEEEDLLRAYRNDPDEYNQTYFLTEKELKEELKKYLKELESADD